MGISRLKIHLGWHRRGHICVPLPFPGPVYSAASQSSVAAAAVRLCVTGRRRAGCVTAVGRNTEETSDSPEEQEKLFSLPSACIGSGPQTAPPPSCVDEEGSFPTVSKGVACRRTEGFWRPRSPEASIVFVVGGSERLFVLRSSALLCLSDPHLIICFLPTSIWVGNVTTASGWGSRSSPDVIVGPVEETVFSFLLGPLLTTGWLERTALDLWAKAIVRVRPT
uniref:uncharacterized protein LOC124055978 isoform X1 n=1 Tax=Scatophagus argus TaxID=75038 RepID=UPI001ED801DA|nr:uncharacterized protein LOC124055978 isoform X1 [Scatophagus argus]